MDELGEYKGFTIIIGTTNKSEEAVFIKGNDKIIAKLVVLRAVRPTYEARGFNKNQKFGEWLINIVEDIIDTQNLKENDSDSEIEYCIYSTDITDEGKLGLDYADLKRDRKK